MGIPLMYYRREEDSALASSEPAVLGEDNLIEKVTANRLPHYEPYGWHHWPEHPWFAYQFRRGLGNPPSQAARGP